MNNKTITLEMPEWVLAELEFLCANNDCSPRTVILDSVISNIHHSRRMRLFGIPYTRVGRSSEEINLICEGLPNVFSEYISKNKKKITQRDSKAENKWLYFPPKRALIGRYNSDLDGVETLSLAWAKLCKFSEDKGIDKQTLRYWLEMQGAKYKTVPLYPGKNNIQYCVVIPSILDTKSLIDLTFLSRSAGLSLAD